MEGDGEFNSVDNKIMGCDIAWTNGVIPVQKE